MSINYEQVVADSQERHLPELLRRSIDIRRAPGNALAIIGMRRSGKTYLCFQMMKDLLESGISRENILYVNFEDERLSSFRNEDFQPLLEVFRQRIDDPDHISYLFFDEIQEVNGWEKFIRRIIDEGGFEVTITGSSAKLLSSEIHTSLRGRALPLEVFPFSFLEFAISRGIEIPKKIPGAKAMARLQACCESYLYSGGFPGVIPLDPATGRQMLQQYLDVVILRDVIERHQVTSVQALRALVQHLVHSPSCRMSINKIYNDFKSRGLTCSKNGLHAFVAHLADAYLIYPIFIHSRSERVRKVNPQKVYLVDTGLLTAASMNITADRGAFLENLIFLSLRRKGDIVEYFHDGGGVETDFVVRDRMNGAIKDLIQVTWSLDNPQTCEREFRGLLTAMDKLNFKRGTIVVWTDHGNIKKNEGVTIIPAWRYLLGLT